MSWTPACAPKLELVWQTLADIASVKSHAATISTLSYAIRFWSKGTKRALFLRHEGFLGAIGAWIKNIGEDEGGES
ncbi:hypothetical protein VTO73DRAFT_483 [Trametes versicolor]